MGLLQKLFFPAPAAAPKEVTKTNVKLLMSAIRNGEMKTVRQMVDGNPDFANACASAPPKKDDGQSPLHIALKTGQFAIADYLIDKGANVNFIEQSKLNEWRTPVLHDAIRAAIFSSEVGRFDLAIATIRKMLQRGADPNAIDSYGNSCLMRAILDAQIRVKSAADSKPSPQLVADIGEVFKSLIQAGADVNATHPDRASAIDETRGSILEKFMV